MLIDGEMSVCETTAEATEVKRRLLTSNWTRLICLFTSCTCEFSFWRKSWFPPNQKCQHWATLQSDFNSRGSWWVCARTCKCAQRFLKTPWQFRAPDAHPVAQFPVATARTLGQNPPIPLKMSASSPAFSVRLRHVGLLPDERGAERLAC